MATVGERLEGTIDEAPSWGIRPVPDEHRRLSGLDLGVLWGDLSVGLLVLVTGALLVPALGLAEALLAIVVGSAIGCLPLALVGLAGQREGVPSMVLFRPLLGTRGSYVPTVLNLLQLVGWTAVEFWAMGRVANAVSIELLGFDAYWFWLLVFAAICTGLALGGPVLVVRRWLERFGVWVLGAAGLWITVQIFTSGKLGQIWGTPGTGGWPTFWTGVDVVIVMPISWLPLVADYNRFAGRKARGFAGTYGGYLAGNVWFYALGAMLVLVAAASPDVVGIGGSVIALAGGAVVVLVLLAGETDEAFANIYSSAVSAQNLLPRVSQRTFIIATSVVGVVLALLLTMDAYEVFLFLIGSVFVPLFGVFAASYFVWKVRDYSERDLFEREGASWVRGGVRWLAMVPWLAGFAVYQWSTPTGPDAWKAGVETVLHGWLKLPVPLLGGAIGASIPGFLVAFVLGVVLLKPRGRRAEARPEVPTAGER